VFDRDGHDNYDQALSRIANSELGKAGKMQAIISVPCFEVWVLLHFQYSTAPFAKAGANSSCDQVLRELKKHFADYQKGHVNVYDKLASRLGDAMKHAARLAKHNDGTGSKNPATQMHVLVEYLRTLK
jgi:hypothetical protein